ncbi:MAG: 3D domain-containing protein [bacterium]
MSVAGPPVTPAWGTAAIPERVVPSPITPSRRDRGSRRRRSWYGAVMLSLIIAAGVSASLLRMNAELAPVLPTLFEPTLVYAEQRLEGALVRGAAAGWALNRNTPLRYGDPVPVALTAYCLQGLTRRDRYVRQGIVASDPRIFPLARYLEIYVGRKYFGRFLIDDTGGRIKGNRLDIWTPTCAEARKFGIQRGTAVLVPRPRGAVKDTLMTGRLNGRAK